MLLIITADDLGYGCSRDQGIFKAYQYGIVTRASLLVNGCSASVAATEALRIGLILGLHLNLTEGHTLTQGETLVDPSTNKFWKTKEFHCNHQSISKDEVLGEIEAQFSKFEELTSGIPPVYVDGHNHIHVHPLVVPLLSMVLKKRGILKIRIPDESTFTKSLRDSVNPETLTFYETVREHAIQARSVWAMNNVLPCAQAFIGMSLMGYRMTLSNLNVAILSIPSECDSCELMCHPGFISTDNDGCGNGPDNFSKSQERVFELDFLCDKNTREFIVEELGMELHGHTSTNISKPCIAIISSLAIATGNLSTCKRLTKIFSIAGYQTVLLDTYELSTEFQSVLKKHNIEIVIGINGKRVGKWILTLDRTFYKLVLILGGTDVNSYQTDAKHLNLLRTIFHVHTIVAFNESLKNSLNHCLERSGANADQLDVRIIPQSFLPNDHHHEFSLRQACDIASDQKILLFVGGIRPVKDPLYILDSVLKWNASGKCQYVIVLLGPLLDNEFASEVLKQVGIHPCLKYHPPIPHGLVQSVVRQADVLINSSVSEGMSNSILEAMVARVPVVARNIPGNVSVIEHGANGFIFNTPDECVALVNRLFLDAVDSRRMVENAFCMCNESQFEKEKSLYTSLLHGGP